MGVKSKAVGFSSFSIDPKVKEKIMDASPEDARTGLWEMKHLLKFQLLSQLHVCDKE